MNEPTQLHNQLTDLITTIARTGVDEHDISNVARVLLDEGDEAVGRVVTGLLMAFTTMVEVSRMTGMSVPQILPEVLSELFRLAFVTGFEVGHEYHRRGYVLPEPVATS